MDYLVTIFDTNDAIIREETFAGVASLAALFLRLSRDWDLGDDIVTVRIEQIGGEDG